MINNILLEKVQKHISKGMINTAFSELKELEIENNELKEELVLIESRYRDYTNYINKTKEHSLSEEDLANEPNKINQALLTHIEKIQQYYQGNTSCHFLSVFNQIPWSAYLIFCMLLAILVSIIKHSISIT